MKRQVEGWVALFYGYRLGGGNQEHIFSFWRIPPFKVVSFSFFQKQWREDKIIEEELLYLFSGQFVLGGCGFEKWFKAAVLVRLYLLTEGPKTSSKWQKWASSLWLKIPEFLLQKQTDRKFLECLLLESLSSIYRFILVTKRKRIII